MLLYIALWYASLALMSVGGYRLGRTVGRAEGEARMRQRLAEREAALLDDGLRLARALDRVVCASDRHVIADAIRAPKDGGA